MNDSATRFPRARHGYDPAAVDEYVNELAEVHRSLQQEVESLRAQLNDSSTEVTLLREQTAALAESSPSPQAMTDRIAKMLRIAVDEVSEMQFEARMEAEQLIANAQAESEAAQAKSRQMLAELAARQRAMETEYAEVMNKAREEAVRITAQAVSESEQMRQVEALRRDQAENELNAELTRARREAETRIEEQLRTTAQECELRVLEAKNEAERRVRIAGEQIDRRLADARRALEDITEKRISILEQLMAVHGSLEGVPAILENAYSEVNVSPESGLVLTNQLDEGDSTAMIVTESGEDD